MTLVIRAGCWASARLQPPDTLQEALEYAQYSVHVISYSSIGIIPFKLCRSRLKLARTIRHYSHLFQRPAVKTIRTGVIVPLERF